MPVMNMVLGTDDLDPKLQVPANFVTTLKFAPIFMKFGSHNKWNMLIMNKYPRHGLDHSCDYWLRMIIGRKTRVTFRT